MNDRNLVVSPNTSTVHHPPAETVATVSSLQLCACGCGQPVTPGTRGMPKRFATSRCRARAWDRAHPRMRPEQQVDPLVADVERILTRAAENESDPAMTLVEEIDRILAGAVPKPK